MTEALRPIHALATLTVPPDAATLLCGLKARADDTREGTILTVTPAGVVVLLIDNGEDLVSDTVPLHELRIEGDHAKALRERLQPYAPQPPINTAAFLEEWKRACQGELSHDPLVVPAPPETYWGLVEQMGHRAHLGEITELADEFLVQVPGEERPRIVPRRTLFALTPCSEQKALWALARGRTAYTDVTGEPNEPEKGWLVRTRVDQDEKALPSIVRVDPTEVHLCNGATIARKDWDRDVLECRRPRGGSEDESRAPRRHRDEDDDTGDYQEDEIPW